MYAEERFKSGDHSGGDGKKVVKASERKMMAKEVLVNHAVSISLVCRIFFY